MNYNLDLQKDLKGLNKKEKAAAKRKIAEFILTEIENSTSAGFSPVTGSKFVDYKSKKYKAIKKKLTGSSTPDLHSKDDLIESIHAGFKENSIDFKVTDSLQKKKLFNHNTGDTVRKRMSLPNDSLDKGREAGFSKPIREGVRDILREIHGNKSNDES